MYKSTTIERPSLQYLVHELGLDFWTLFFWTSTLNMPITQPFFNRKPLHVIEAASHLLVKVSIFLGVFHSFNLCPWGSWFHLGIFVQSHVLVESNFISSRQPIPVLGRTSFFSSRIVFAGLNEFYLGLFESNLKGCRISNP